MDSIRKEQVVLFVGSGFSIKAGAPRSCDLVEAFMNGMTEEERSSLQGRQLDYVSGEFEEAYGREKLLEILEKQMNFEKKDLSDHDAIRKIPHFHAIITTNYDTLLEDTYGEDCYVIRTTEDCVHIPGDKVIVYKIHGDLKSKDNIILTKRDYTNFFEGGRNSELWSVVKTELLRHDVLFAGYSVEDENIFKIVEKINREASCTDHRFYAVAPIGYKRKIGKLESAGIIHINAKAEDVLPQIIRVLERKIHSDYKVGDVQYGTYIKFCHFYGINPIIKPGVNGEQHSVENYEFLCPGRLSVQLTSSSKKMDVLRKRDITNFKDRLPDAVGLGNVPVLKFSKEEIEILDINFNGLTINDRDDIKSVVFVPQQKEVEDTLQVRSIGFSKKVRYTIYGDGENAHIVLDTGICKLGFIYNVSRNIWSMSMELADKYKDNSEAQKWIDFLIALYDAKPVKSVKLQGEFSIVKDSSTVKWLKLAKHYYNNISAVEMNYGVAFEEYDNYTFERLKTSELIVASSEGRFINTTRAGGETFCVNMAESIETLNANSITIGSPIFTALTCTGISITICGKEFTFQNRHVIIENSEVTGLENKGGNVVQICLKTKGAVYEILSDKSLNDFIKTENAIQMQVANTNQAQ